MSSRGSSRKMCAAADTAERDGETAPIDVDDTDDPPIPPESFAAALQRIQEQAAAMARMQEQGNALIMQLAQLQTQLGEQAAGRVAAEGVANAAVWSSSAFNGRNRGRRGHGRGHRLRGVLLSLPRALLALARERCEVHDL